MSAEAGKFELGPRDGTLQVRTYREGMASKAGHDLVIEVADWTARVGRAPDGSPASIELDADARSLQVREGTGGVKPLTAKDRAEIRRIIDDKVLRGQPIGFRSTAVKSDAGQLSVSGELTIGGSTRPVTARLDVGGDGRVTGTIPLTQSEWGIKPYRGLMGALRVRDALEIVLDVRLPQG